MIRFGPSGVDRVGSVMATAALLSAAVVLISACGGPSPAPGAGNFAGTVSIGFFADLGGVYQANGYPMVNGALVQANRINDAGGLKVAGKSYRLAISVCNTNSDSALAATCARKFVQDQKLKFVMGANGALAPVVASVTDPDGVMYFNVSAALGAIVQQNKLKHIFFAAPSITNRVSATVRGVQQIWPTAKTIAYLYADDPTAALLPPLQMAFQSSGFTNVASQKFSAANTGQDLTPQLSAIRQNHPDILFTGWSQDQVAPVLNANKTLQVASKIALFSGSGVCTALADSAGSTQQVLNNNQVGADLDHPANAEASSFAKAYLAYVSPTGQSIYKSPLAISGKSSALYYSDAIALLAAAMTDAGTTQDVNAIEGSLLRTKIAGIQGAYSMDASHYVRVGMTFCTLNVDKPGALGSFYLPPAQ